MMTVAVPPDIETSSESYAARFAGRTGRWLLDVQGCGTLQLMKAFPNSTVLEVGGGHGQLTPYLLEAGHKVTIHGSKPECMARVTKYLTTGRCEFRAGDLQQLPFPDKSHDVVIAYHLLSHLLEPEPFIAELVRVARKAVIVDFPTDRSINGVTMGLFWIKKKLEGNTRTFLTHDEKKVVNLFKRYGFRRSGRFAKFLIPMVLHRKLGIPRLSAMVEDFFRTAGMTSAFGSPVISCFVSEAALLL
jgi:ubiquinone/menaquinone biosynthesis C-methylase UbiE